MLEGTIFGNCGIAWYCSLTVFNSMLTAEVRKVTSGVVSSCHKLALGRVQHCRKVQNVKCTASLNLKSSFFFLPEMLSQKCINICFIFDNKVINFQ